MDLGKKVNFVWRLLATGFAFATFSVMGCLFRFTICPLICLLRKPGPAREQSARRVVFSSFRFFIGMLKFLGIMDLKLEGIEKLQRKGILICPSHPTLIDVVILMSLVDNANCIVKAALKQSFALKSPVTTTGYIANDSGPELVKTCAESLAAGDHLIIFPEGTRTRPGVEPRLQHGAAAAALYAKHNVTPVVITCTPPSLMKGVPWYSIPDEKMHFCVTVGDDIEIEPFLEIERELGRPIAVRRLTEEIKRRIFPNGNNR